MRQLNSKIRNKIFNYLFSRLGLKKSTRGWYRSDCPYCYGHHTFGIHPLENRAHCFKCGEKASPIQLIMYLERAPDFSTVYKMLQIQEEYRSFDFSTYSSKPLQQKEVSLPEGYINIGLAGSQGILGRSAVSYLKGRNFNIQRLSEAGVGYCESGEYFGYIIVPYYLRGELVYFQGRRFFGSGPKMKNPPEEEFGIGKSQVLFNGDALYIYKNIYLVESATNSLTLGNKGVGLSGKTPSQKQISQIIQSPCTGVTLILDPDAYKESILLGMTLVHYKKVRLVKLPDEMVIKGELQPPDVNAIGKPATMKFVKESKWLTYNELNRLRINLKIHA